MSLNMADEIRFLVDDGLPGGMRTMMHLARLSGNPKARAVAALSTGKEAVARSYNGAVVNRIGARQGRREACQWGRMRSASRQMPYRQGH